MGIFEGRLKWCENGGEMGKDHFMRYFMAATEHTVLFVPKKTF